MKISLLTIGTEIVTGEILNSNAHWMSERLEGLNLEVVHHVSVADSKKVILEALDYISSSDILMVTGGLGPTQDDLTREVIAEWIGEPLEFSELAWQILNEWMSERGRTPMESHKHQCQFPKKHRLLRNNVGTAHGFLVEKGEQQIYVLPGPPKELRPMWMNEVESRLPKGGLSPWIKWVFEGLPESEVADRFEKLLRKSVDPKTIEIGYRASVPLIHVKVREAYVPKGLAEAVREEFGKSLKSYNGLYS